jgi:hypothetical protein
MAFPRFDDEVCFCHRPLLFFGAFIQHLKWRLAWKVLGMTIGRVAIKPKMSSLESKLFH